MSPIGTAAYDGLIPGADLPPLVERAVDLARRLGFANSCRPEHGRLLRAPTSPPSSPPAAFPPVSSRLGGSPAPRA